MTKTEFKEMLFRTIQELKLEKHVDSLFSRDEGLYKTVTVEEQQDVEKEDKYVKICDYNVRTVMGYYSLFISYVYDYYEATAGTDLAVGLMKKYIGQSLESAQVQSDLIYMKHHQVIKDATGPERQLAIAVYHAELTWGLYYHIQSLTCSIQKIEIAMGQALTSQNQNSPSTKGTQS